MTFDVVIPVYGQPDCTVACLQSLRRTQRSYRVIMVDNGTPAAELEPVLGELRHHPYMLIRNETNRGFIKATNQGIEASTAPYVVLLNNDTVVYAGLFEKLRRACDSTEMDVGAAGPVSSSGWQGINNLRQKIPDFRDAPGPGPKAAVWCADHLAGRYRRVGTRKLLSGMLAFFCVMLPRRTIDDIGLLDERFGEGFGDDDEYCERIRQADKALLLVMDAYVDHHHRTTFRALYSDRQIQEKQLAAMELLDRVIRE